MSCSVRYLCRRLLLTERNALAMAGVTEKGGDSRNPNFRSSLGAGEKGMGVSVVFAWG